MSTFELAAPPLGAWRQGNTGVEGVWRFDSGRPGREVMVSALVHGNEICGAWAVLAALQARLPVQQGALTMVLCNLSAFDRFDPLDPDASRCVEQDMNRLWGSATQEAPSNDEQRRVAALKPFVERADWLLDLHSMHAPGPALSLTGPLPHHARQAARLGLPALLVADTGHAAGVRMRDHGRFADPNDAEAFALLVECGWHGAAASRTVALDAMHRFLAASGVVEAAHLPTAWLQNQANVQKPSSLLQVTHAITVAEGEPPRFAQAWCSGQTIERKGTLIGRNGGQDFFTPYDHCVLIMPTLLHADVGATLVRLAQRVSLSH